MTRCIARWRTFIQTNRALCTGLALCCATALAATEVSFMGGYDPDRPETPITQEIQKLATETPGLEPVRWGGLHLPGAGGRSPLLLAMAGGNAPDIYQCWFHIIQNDIKNGFLLPLDPWLGANGKDWPGWQAVPELWHQVASSNGHVYGLPSASVAYYGILYRKDLVREAGLDPEALPQTWEAFLDWCRLIIGRAPTGRGAARRAFAVCEAPWNWLPWMQSAGASPVVQQRVSPLHGTTLTFPMEDSHPVTDEGEDLSGVPPTWRANFDSPEAIAAAKYLQQLVWEPWVLVPGRDEPLSLTAEEAERGQAVREGKTIAFDRASVRKGVCRVVPLSKYNAAEAFIRGEAVAMFAGFDAMERITGEGGLDPDLVGIMPFPAANASLPRLFQAHRHYWAASYTVGQRPPEEQALVLKALLRLSSREMNDATIRTQVLEGNARFCNPQDLKRLGLEAYLEEIPATIRDLYAQIEAGKIVLRTEPFVGFWQGVSDLVQRRLLSLILSEAGHDLDVAAALQAINADANRGLMFAIEDSQIAPYRPAAYRIVTILVVALLTLLTVVVVRHARKKPLPRAAAESELKRRNPVKIVMLMLLPALLSITVWSYWPLIQGVLMAFRDYHIVGESPWVGLDNFIVVATDANFWASVGRTLKYVAITMTLGFLTPVILAIMLSEIPYGRIFFRTMYFLPHLTSTLVITLLWQLMYDPTEAGMLNQLLAFFHLPHQTWLQDPAWAMVCCILPGVWAGAGMASLIYIAALQALPSDYYEAAAIDGAGFFARIRHILLPQLMPLMVINFVGAFIASFQSIGGIFLLTFGGPGDATNVLSLAIWKEAYNNLRLGSATTMAWFLGTALIGFTYLQFRILRKVEFRRAEGN